MIPSFRLPARLHSVATSSQPFPKPIEIHMRGIEIQKNEPVDRALKRLKGLLDSEGILEEMRRRRSFETVTQRKQRKERTASKRHAIRWKFQRVKPVEDTES
jgi:small subunit ribosomal protein S21